MGDRKAKLESRVLRWAIYDIASSNYHAIVPTFFGLYFLGLADGAAHSIAKAWWGAAVASSLLVAAVLAPLVGAWADRTGRWFGALLGLTVVCVVAVVLLPGAARAGILAGCLLFVLAQSSYTMASSIYDSLVVEVAPATHRGRASAIGWSLGLAGGLLGTLAALALVEGHAPQEQVARLELAFLVSGALFAAFAVPGLAAVRRVASRPAAASPLGVTGSVARLVETLRDWRAHRELLKLLGSFFLVNDVLVTLQFFVAVVLATKFGIAVDGILRLLALATLIAIPSTLLWGVLADRWGLRRSLVLLAIGLAGGVVLLAFSHTPWTPTLAFVLFGFVYGSVQAVYRAYYASLVPTHRAAELFGFNAVVGRVSAIAGPLIFGVVAALWGDNVALLTLLIPLVLGIALLARVNAGDVRPATEASTA